MIARAGEQIGAIGPAFYFTEETLQIGRQHGLDGFRFYFLGRGGVLGDVESRVVAAAFGYFNPALVETIWTSARERSDLSPREAGRAYLRCAAEFGRKHFQNLELEQFCEAADRVNDAADPAGLALYAGTSAEALETDPPARAMQLCTVLREFRGSAHLLAIRATPGIDPVTAHGIRRPGAWTLFGHAEAELPSGDDAGRSALRDADALTDELVAPAFDVLGDEGRTALLDGLAMMQARLPDFDGPRRG